MSNIKKEDTLPDPSILRSNLSPNAADSSQIKKDEELKRQELENQKKFDTKLMTYFGNEFYERRLEIPPKRVMFEPFRLEESESQIIDKHKILDKLQDIERLLDEKIYKTRIDLQENLLAPKTRMNANLRLQIFAYKDKEGESPNLIIGVRGRIFEKNSNPRRDTRESFNKEEDKININLDSKEKSEEKPLLINNIVSNQSQTLSRKISCKKFSHYFSKIEIKFDNNLYNEILWVNNNNSDLKLTKTESQEQSIDYDGFTIKRPYTADDFSMRFLFYLNSPYQEYNLSPKLSELLDIKRETRPKILYHLWQYIKINSLQDNEDPTVVINNNYLIDLFKCDKMKMSSLPSRLNDHLQKIPPIEIKFNVKNLCEDKSKNQLLANIKVTINDPFYYTLLGFLSNLNEESLLFPKKVFSVGNITLPNASRYDKYLFKINEYDKKYSTLISAFRKHKYHYDFYDAFDKDPILFIRNFLVQQKELIRKMNEAMNVHQRIDSTSSEYFIEYEEVIREYVDKYLNKKRNNPDSISAKKTK